MLYFLFKKTIVFLSYKTSYSNHNIWGITSFSHLETRFCESVSGKLWIFYIYVYTLYIHLFLPFSLDTSTTVDGNFSKKQSELYLIFGYLFILAFSIPYSLTFIIFKKIWLSFVSQKNVILIISVAKVDYLQIIADFLIYTRQINKGKLKLLHTLFSYLR